MHKHCYFKNCGMLDLFGVCVSLLFFCRCPACLEVVLLSFLDCLGGFFWVFWCTLALVILSPSQCLLLVLGLSMKPFQLSKKLLFVTSSASQNLPKKKNLFGDLYTNIPYTSGWKIKGNLLNWATYMVKCFKKNSPMNMIYSNSITLIEVGFSEDWW